MLPSAVLLGDLRDVSGVPGHQGYFRRVGGMPRAQGGAVAVVACVSSGYSGAAVLFSCRVFEVLHTNVPRAAR